MALLNDPEGHQPHGPRLGLSYSELNEPSPQTFYQPADAEQQELGRKLTQQAEKAVNFTAAIDDYQMWCELNWKQPHGTQASANHSTSKLIEEITELKEELYRPEAANSSADIISELGDVLWTTTAVASDLMINVKHGLMMLMDKYGHNIRRLEDYRPPAWVKHAQTLTFNDALTAKHIDEMVSAGYQSEEAAIMYVDDGDVIGPPEISDAIDHLDTNSRMLTSIARYNYGDDIYQSGAVQQAEVAEYLIARIYMDVAFLAKHTAASSLSDVIKDNIQKLSHRVSTNTVDKADGDRAT